MTDTQRETNGSMTDRVQFVAGDEVLAVVESSMVPRKDSFVIIEGNEWQAYHQVHTIKDGTHTTTVFVWRPDGGFSEGDIREIVRSTVGRQRSEEREREVDHD